MYIGKRQLGTMFRCWKEASIKDVRANNRGHSIVAFMKLPMHSKGKYMEDTYWIYIQIQYKEQQKKFGEDGRELQSSRTAPATFNPQQVGKKKIPISNLREPLPVSDDNTELDSLTCVAKYQKVAELGL